MFVGKLCFEHSRAYSQSDFYNCDRGVGASFKTSGFRENWRRTSCGACLRQSGESRRAVTWSSNCLVSRNAANQIKTVSLSLTGSLEKLFLAVSVSNAAITYAPVIVNRGFIIFSKNCVKLFIADLST